MSDEKRQDHHGCFALEFRYVTLKILKRTSHRGILPWLYQPFNKDHDCGLPFAYKSGKTFMDD